MSWKDVLTIVPAWIGMITGGVSVAYVVAESRRKARYERPRMSFSTETQIKDRLSLIDIRIENAGRDAFVLDAVHVLAPSNVELIDNSYVSDFNSALNAPGHRTIALSGSQEVASGDFAHWRGLVRYASGAALAGPVELAADLRVLSERERRLRVTSTRTITP